MTLKIGRASLRTPKDVDLVARNVIDDGMLVTGSPNPALTANGSEGYLLVGGEHGSTAQDTIDDLMLERRRLGSVYVEDDSASPAVPSGYYVIEDLNAQKPRGAPRYRPWRAQITSTPSPLVVRQAESDSILGTVTADSTADEGSKVVITPTAAERNALVAGSDLVLALRLDEMSGTDGANLVANPGFETWTTSPGVPDSWTNADGNASQYTKETGIPDAGVNSCKITSDGSGDYPGVRQTFAPGAKSIYVKMRVRYPAGSNIIFQVYNLTDSAYISDASAVNLGIAADTWGTVAVTFNAIAGKTYRVAAYVNCVGFVAGRIGYVDSIVVQEIQAKDVSGQGNHGTLSGAANTSGPTIGATGKLGTAYSFDGVDDYVQVPDHPGLSIMTTGQLSIECWLKRASAAGSPAIAFGKAAGPYEYAVEIDDALTLYVLDSGGSALVYATTGSVLNDTNWHHIAIVISATSASAGTIAIYVDGVLVLGEAFSSAYSMSDTASAFYIGRKGDGAGGLFNGVIDELRIYRRALTATEVRARYNATTGGVRPTDDISPTQEKLNLPAGTYRAIARAYGVTTATARLRWRILDTLGAVLASGSQVAITPAGSWLDIDLGSLTVPQANDKANQLLVTIDDPTNTNAIWLDRIIIAPA